MSEGTGIRAVERRDLGSLRAWRSDPLVSRTALGRRFPVTEVGEEEWFLGLGQGEFPTRVAWSVVDATGGLVGLVRLADIDWIHRTCWFGVWIAPESWGAGHGRGATVLACGHAFRELGLRQVRLHVLASHPAARAIYGSVGFREEGTMRGAVLVDGSPEDLVQMVLEPGTFAAT